jgi:hypothetical protein
MLRGKQRFGPMFTGLVTLLRVKSTFGAPTPRVGLRSCEWGWDAEQGTFPHVGARLQSKRATARCGLRRGLEDEPYVSNLPGIFPKGRSEPTHVELLRLLNWERFGISRLGYGCAGVADCAGIKLRRDFVDGREPRSGI